MRIDQEMVWALKKAWLERVWLDRHFSRPTEDPAIGNLTKWEATHDLTEVEAKTFSLLLEGYNSEDIARINQEDPSTVRRRIERIKARVPNLQEKIQYIAELRRGDEFHSDEIDMGLDQSTGVHLACALCNRPIRPRDVLCGVCYHKYQKELNAPWMKSIIKSHRA